MHPLVPVAIRFAFVGEVPAHPAAKAQARGRENARTLSRHSTNFVISKKQQPFRAVPATNTASNTHDGKTSDGIS